MTKVKDPNRRSVLMAAAALPAALGFAKAAVAQADDAPFDRGSATAAAAAAVAFLDSLSEPQRNRVLYRASDPALRTWFYFPSRRDRNGIALADLSPEQFDAAFGLVAAILSDSGYRQFIGVIAAEDELGRRNNEPHVNSGRYFIAIFGIPGPTERFTVQINGHHLAINTTFDAGMVSPTPAFTGADPVEIDLDGRRVRPMQAKTQAYAGLLAALTEAERSAARIGAVDDVRMGTGASETYPSPEGMRVQDLGLPGQDAVIGVIRAWVEDAPAPVAQALLRRYQADLGRTRLAWAGSDDPDRRGAYLRLDGPDLWLEFSNVGRFGNGDNHYHSVLRDKRHDYLALMA
jgi:hypothetical protein